jgi:hypothetical protein
VTHTPGPWHAQGNYIYRAFPATPELIARCPDMEHMPYLDNARLIAAAPALLEACEDALEMAEYLSALWGTAHGDDYAEMVERLTTVIAQAKGEEVEQ